MTDQYRDFVEHPRYGRSPKVTGLNPDPLQIGVDLGRATTLQEVVLKYELVLGEMWPYGDALVNTAESRRVPNTAIVADLQKQTRATVPVTHYFDLERRCRDCRRQFIFFAEEQKHWYEELGFGLHADCVRCFECRRRQQGVARLRECYEFLFHVQCRTEEQTLELVECCLALVEAEVFTPRKREFARMLLNSIDQHSDVRRHPRYADLVQRSRC